MEKSYLTDVFSIWVLFFIYSLFLYAVFILTSIKLYKGNHNVILIYSFYYLLYTSIPVLDFFFNFVPFYPDSITYSNFLIGNTHDSSSLGYQSTEVIYNLFSYIIFKEPFLFISFQIFFFFVSSIFMYGAWTKYIGSYSPVGHRLFVVLYFAYPSMLLYIPTPLRESLFIFSFSLLIYSLFAKRKENQILMFVLGLVFLFLIRKQLALISLFYISSYLILIRLKPLWRLLIAGSTTIIAIQVLHIFGITASFLSGFRMWAVNNHKASGFTYGIVNWESYYDIFYSIPLLSLQYLLSPLPILTDLNPLELSGLLLDLIYVLLLLIIVLCSLKLKAYSFWLLFILALIVLPAGYEYFISGAVRHRIPAILILTLLASEGTRRMKFLYQYNITFRKYSIKYE